MPGVVVVVVVVVVEVVVVDVVVIPIGGPPSTQKPPQSGWALHSAKQPLTAPKTVCTLTLIKKFDELGSGRGLNKVPAGYFLPPLEEWLWLKNACSQEVIMSDWRDTTWKSGKVGAY